MHFDVMNALHQPHQIADRQFWRNAIQTCGRDRNRQYATDTINAKSHIK